MNNVTDIIKLMLPLLILELGLKVFCLYRLSKDEVKYLPKLAWGAIILFVNTIGPLMYLLIGRERE